MLQSKLYWAGVPAVTCFVATTAQGYATFLPTTIYTIVGADFENFWCE